MVRPQQSGPQAGSRTLIYSISLDNLVTRIKTSLSIKPASTRNYNSFATWILDRKPLSRKETEFVKYKEDFIALSDEQEGGWLDGLVEDMLSYLPRRLAQVYSTSHLFEFERTRMQEISDV